MADINGADGITTSTDQIKRTITIKMSQEAIALLDKAGTALQNEDVPSWSMEDNKPTYTPSEVGALPSNGTAVKATALETSRNISLSGDVTGSSVFDGTADTTISSTLKPSGVTSGTYSKLTVDGKGIVTDGENLTAADIPALTLSKISDAGTAASKDVGASSGNIPVLGTDGKLDPSLMHSIAITDTYPVVNQASMLALSADKGDVAIRTDISKSFILTQAPASVLSNWQELIHPESPVESVAGKIGAVTLTKGDISGLENVDNTADAIKVVNKAATADKWTTGRSITFTNAVTGSATIDGSGDITIELTVTGGTPSTLAYGDTANAGVSTTAARSDHRHGMPSAPRVENGVLYLS